MRKHELKGPLGRPRYRGENNNIESNLEVMGDWVCTGFIWLRIRSSCVSV
jgi:hypothetical protein